MSSETYAFQAEINQLLSLIINAFYSNKEIFLRELVSNASDALDKVRYYTLHDASKVVNNDVPLRIRLIPDRSNNILMIEDTGVGMTKNELIENIGTIARSGTKSFMQALTDGKADVSLIGQFGVGFYSAYLVADKVRVVTKSDSEPQQWQWESNAGGTFTITESSEDNLPRGTRIYLYLKEDQKEYLEESRIKEVVRKHNGFLNFPIELEVEKQVEEEVETSTEDTDATKDDDGEVKVEDVDTKKEKEKRMVTKKEFEQVNVDNPVWLRKPADVSEDEYKAFYKSFTGEWVEPLAWKHFSAEGSVEFKTLLYLPKNAAYNVITSENPKTFKLYVKRVFISDDYKELVPEYLTFMKGVIDSDDLPLNISREMLQQNNVMRVIKKTLVKRALELFSELAENDKEKYESFYVNFHKNLKLGVIDDRKNRDKLLELLRYHSSKEEGRVSLTDYIGRMKEGQTNIYYLSGESIDAMKRSPFIKKLIADGYEVLFMSDAMDEHMMQNITEFKDKKFVCCSKDEPLFDGDADKQKQLTEENKDLCEFVKLQIRPTNIDSDYHFDVKISTRLIDAPCMVSSTPYGSTANMERLLKAQAMTNATSEMIWKATKARRVVELNLDHPFIKKVKDAVDSKADTTEFKETINILYEIALVQSGYSLDDTQSFVERVTKFVLSNVDGDAKP